MDLGECWDDGACKVQVDMVSGVEESGVGNDRVRFGGVEVGGARGGGVKDGVGTLSVSNISKSGEISITELLSEPVGISFDSSEFSVDTTNESADTSSDHQIAEDCELSSKIMETFQQKRKYFDQQNSEPHELTESLDVYDFSVHEKTDASSNVESNINEKTEVTCCNYFCLNQKIGSQIKGKFKEIKERCSTDRKQYLLDHLINQEEMNIPTHGFQFFGKMFCKKSFVEISEVSDYIVTQVCKAFERGQVTFVHGNEIGMRETEATLGFVIWMKHHATNYGNHVPDEETIILPACFSLKDLFHQYTEEAPPPLIKIPTFYSLVKSRFGPNRVDKSNPHIRISSYSKHSKCDQCILLEKFQRTCKKEQDVVFSKSLKQAHKLTYQRSYQAIQEERYKALSDPENHIFIQVDDMDNYKSHLPQSPEIGKTSGTLFRLPTKVTGCIVWSGKYAQNRKVVFYINNNQFEQSGSKLVSILYRLLQKVIEDFGSLPKHLGINLDNCWRF